MTLISYAQNYEDVILWRALKHIKKGFYIDLGAAWPDTDSVTNLFYEFGWNGVNVDANPDLIDLYHTQRARDINVCVGIDAGPGEKSFYSCRNPGLSTFSEKIAKQHEAYGEPYQVLTVPTLSFDEMWRAHVHQGQEVHFLKIDLEGNEFVAIESNDWVVNRPWIIVVEATLPMTQVESYKDWESILLEHEYQFAYWDGLNRFYVSKEHEELMDAFNAPPNVFDDFIRHEHFVANAKVLDVESQLFYKNEELVVSHTELFETQSSLDETQSSLDETQSSLDETKNNLDETRTELEKIRNDLEVTWSKLVISRAELTEISSRLEAIHSSRFWKITFPFRKVVDLIKLLSKYLRSNLKTILGKLLFFVIGYIKKRSVLKRFVIAFLKRVKLYSYLKNKVARQKVFSVNGIRRPAAYDKLSVRAQEIYKQLKPDWK